MSMTSRSHPAEEVLEQYSLGRLPEAEAELAEEHLLVCPPCQDRLQEIDEFVLAMRQAAAEMEEPLPSPTRRRRTVFSRLWMFPKPVWAGALAAATVVVLLLPWQWRSGSPYEVPLQSFRGSEAMLASTAPSDRPLILGIDLTQLPDHPSYRVEVVDWRGRSVCESAVEPTDDLISLPLDRSLSRGQYWVRVYDSSELLREFSLRVE